MDSYSERVGRVTQVPGCVAFWDFVQREEGAGRRFIAHSPGAPGADYALDVSNYAAIYWGTGRKPSYADFPLMGRGPFGQAVRIRREVEPDFRPHFLVPRTRLHDTPLDIKGTDASVTVVAWIVREGGNHAIAGIWHEGTDLVQTETAEIKKVARGQRQYALFSGLNFPGAACGHISENGTNSFLNQYALHKSNSGDVVAQVPVNASAETLDRSWHVFGMTFDRKAHEISAWIDGKATERWIANPGNDKLLSYAVNAWRQGHLNRIAGLQPGEDPSFPSDQYYNPPEDDPLSVTILEETDGIRIESRLYRYTRVKVKLTKAPDGSLIETERDLESLRLNPWWYPHGIYEPSDPEAGGPFTIGRVVHSARGVGFTGWIGGVAVFNRALGKEEMAALARIAEGGPISLQRKL